MRIVFLSVFYPFRGGIAQFSTALYKVLSKTNSVFAVNFKRQYPKILFPGKSQFVSSEDLVEKINSERLIDSINPFSYRKTKKEINKFHPELLIVNYWMSFFALLKGYIAKKSNADVKLAILHNLIPHEKKFYDRIVNSYFVKQFDGFIVMSDKVKRDLLELYPNSTILKLNHPNYTHFGKKLDRNTSLKQLNIDENKKVILFFGLIRAYKGLDVLLEAFSDLSTDYHLIVAGESYEDFGIYQDIIDKKELDKNLLLNLNYLSDTDVALYFSATDLCVLPYKNATQSGIVAIANQFEIPVIATNVGGLAESVVNNLEGYIVEPNNSIQLKEAIHLYFNENKKVEFVKNIHQKNIKLTWEYFAEEMEKFAKSLKKG